jgi:hypothetical protein
MSLLPRTTLHSDSEQLVIFFNRTYRLFLNTVHCYNLLEDYCYYEIQIHKALCEFAVEKGYCWLKEASPPYT